MEQSKSMRVEVICRETIKPSSPSANPDQPGSFKLSLLDQFTLPVYVPALLFYKTTPCDGSSKGKEINERSQRLKSSLSETLTRFYPFSGRFIDPFTISCNDEGVDYSEAQVLNCSLFHVLEKPNPKQLDLLVPNESPLTTQPLLLVQVSFFECGGMAIGMKFHHKVADAATFAIFTNAWANSALGNIKSVVMPDFSASTIFPPIDSLPLSPETQPSQMNIPSTIRTSRFVFLPSELAVLQAKATSTNNPRPTRFEAVSAFMWKTKLQSTREPRLELKKPSALTWAVNLRSKLKPPLAEHCFGNIVGSAIHEVKEVDGEDLGSLTDLLRRGTIDICNDYIQVIKGDTSVRGIFELEMNKKEKFERAMAGMVEWCLITSWCKLPFYEANFGWGKPLWVANGVSQEVPNVIVLMDTRDGHGIEAWVTLTEAEMNVLESNQELQKYASLNPSISPCYYLGIEFE